MTLYAKLKVYLQYLLPHHLLTAFAGFCAEIKINWIKDFLIFYFLKKYSINMSEALIENPYAYLSFNDFFTRKLKSHLRPICDQQNAIVSPVDGTLSVIGTVQKQSLLQAKNMYFDLSSLLGEDKEAVAYFEKASYATLYLAPYDYHRIHMPFKGKLIKTIFVPGDLFSVNRMTAQLVPKLYSRNERLICLFETEIGIMAVILVGAMIVGSIQTVWMKQPIKSRAILIEQPCEEISLEKGAELGLFKLGSTVILLFQDKKIEWAASLVSNQQYLYGKAIAYTQ